MSQAPTESGRTAAMRTRARAIRAAGGIDAAVAGGTLPKLVDTTLSEGLVLGLLKQGVSQVSRHLRPRLDRSRRGAAHLRGGGRHPHVQLPQRGGHGARRHGAALAVRRDSSGRDLDRPGRDAGHGRRAGCRLERRRRLPHLRRRDDLRRRLQHAAGAEGGAGPVRADDGHHGPFLRAAYAGRLARRAAPRRAHGQPSLSRGAVLPAAAAQHPAGTADTQSCRVAASGPTCRRWLPRPTPD